MPMCKIDPMRDGAGIAVAARRPAAAARAQEGIRWVGFPCYEGYVYNELYTSHIFIIIFTFIIYIYIL